MSTERLSLTPDKGHDGHVFCHVRSLVMDFRFIFLYRVELNSLTSREDDKLSRYLANDSVFFSLKVVLFVSKMSSSS